MAQIKNCYLKSIFLILTRCGVKCYCQGGGQRRKSSVQLTRVNHCGPGLFGVTSAWKVAALESEISQQNRPAAVAATAYPWAAYRGQRTGGHSPAGKPGGWWEEHSIEARAVLGPALISQKYHMECTVEHATQISRHPTIHSLARALSRHVLQHCTAAVRLFLLLGVIVHLADHLGEHLVHVGPAFGTGFEEGAAPILGERHTLDGGHLALVLEVQFVGHQQDGHSLRVLHPGDELLHGLDVLERLVVGQTVHDHEALPVFDVEVAHTGELLGAGRVQDLEHARRTVHLDFLAVEVLDGRVVLLHEAAGHELHGEGALANPARPQHHHFELAHFSRRRRPARQGTRRFRWAAKCPVDRSRQTHLHAGCFTAFCVRPPAHRVRTQTAILQDWLTATGPLPALAWLRSVRSAAAPRAQRRLDLSVAKQTAEPSGQPHNEHQHWNDHQTHN